MSKEIDTKEALKQLAPEHKATKCDQCVHPNHDGLCECGPGRNKEPPAFYRRRDREAEEIERLEKKALHLSGVAELKRLKAEVRQSEIWRRVHECYRLMKQSGVTDVDGPTSADDTLKLFDELMKIINNGIVTKPDDDVKIGTEAVRPNTGRPPLSEIVKAKDKAYLERLAEIDAIGKEGDPPPASRSSLGRPPLKDIIADRLLKQMAEEDTLPESLRHTSQGSNLNRKIWDHKNMNNMDKVDIEVLQKKLVTDPLELLSNEASILEERIASAIKDHLKASRNLQMLKNQLQTVYGKLGVQPGNISSSLETEALTQSLSSCLFGR